MYTESLALLYLSELNFDLKKFNNLIITNLVIPVLLFFSFFSLESRQKISISKTEYNLIINSIKIKMFSWSHRTKTIFLPFQG